MSDDDVVLLESPPRVASRSTNDDDDEIVWVDPLRPVRGPVFGGPVRAPARLQKYRHLTEDQYALLLKRKAFGAAFPLIYKPIDANMSHERRSKQVFRYIQQFGWCFPPEDTRKAIFGRVKIVFGRKQDSLPNEECPICMKEGADLTLTCACRSPLYCADCLRDWQKQKKTETKDYIPCPICTKPTKPLNIRWALPDQPLLESQRKKDRARKKKQLTEDLAKKEKERLRQIKRHVERAAKREKVLLPQRPM